MKITLIFIGLASLIAVAYPCQTTQQLPDSRIQTVEASLFPFSPGPQENSAAPQKAQTLTERMAEYKIPGASVAVIEDGKVPTLVQVLKGAAPAQNKPAVMETVPEAEWRYSNFGYVDSILGHSPRWILTRREARVLNRLFGDIIGECADLKT